MVATSLTSILDSDQIAAVLPQITQMREPQRAEAILNCLNEQVDDELVQIEIAETIAGLPTAVPTAQPPVMTPIFVPEERQASPSTRAYIEAFDQLIVEREQLCRQVNDVAPQVERNEVEAFPDLQTQLEALEAERSRLVSESSTLVNTKQALQSELTAFQARLGETENGAQAELNNVQTELDEVSQQIRQLETEQPDAPELTVLRQRQQTLSTDRDALRSVLNNDLLQTRGTEIAASLEQIDNRLQNTRAELQTVQRQINQVRRALEQQAVETNTNNPSPIETSSTGTLSAVFGFVREFLTADQRKADNEKETLAVSGVDPRYNPRQRYEDALRDEAQMASAVAGSSGSGMSC
jgi:SMC interacting uncharacterized protein involved in chromosome segregation